jgi:hypothetical protein
MVASLPIAFDCGRDGIQHVLVPKRFDQEIDSSSLHGPDGRRNIAMAGHENDWDVNIRLGELDLKVQAAEVWQSNVEHQTAGYVRNPPLQQLSGRTQNVYPEAHGSKDITERLAHGGIVINDEDHWLRFERAYHQLLPGATFSSVYVDPDSIDGSSLSLVADC